MDTTTVHPLLEALIALLLVVGGSFALVGAIGLVRFRDFFMRLHAPTKASTLGVGGVLVASMRLNGARAKPHATLRLTMDTTSVTMVSGTTKPIITSPKAWSPSWRCAAITR